MVTGNVIMMKTGTVEPGQTTEAAMIVMYLVGALVVIGPHEAAIVSGVTIAMLLHLREELHLWVRRMSDKDVRAVMQFVVIWLVILPALPDRTYGPYDVINPRQVWWMVVLIVGLNLAGYAAFRVFGARTGTALAGVLGGVISSTATTVSYSRQTAIDMGRSGTALVVIWVASGVVFVRVMLEIGVVAPAFLPVAAGPLGVMLLVFAIVAGLIWKSATTPGDVPLDPGNPTELKPAILFGALYAVVLLIVAAAQDLLGDTGLFAAAALSGLTDVDAITLSTSRLVATGRLEGDTAWRLILLAILSNLLFKFGIAWMLGRRAFAMKLGRVVGVAIAAGVALLVFWP
jgi:uncharacterized membrane protein (DUF4010 family)